MTDMHQFPRGVHRIVIFAIRPDTGFAGYRKKIRKYEYNSNISHKIIRDYHLFPKIR